MVRAGHGESGTWWGRGHGESGTCSERDMLRAGHGQSGTWSERDMVRAGQRLSHLPAGAL